MPFLGFVKRLKHILPRLANWEMARKILVAEALDPEPTALVKFFDDPPRNKVSLLKYPPPPSPSPSSSVNGTNRVNGEGTTGGDFQGVGPHKDRGYLN